MRDWYPHLSESEGDVVINLYHENSDCSRFLHEWFNQETNEGSRGFWNSLSFPLLYWTGASVSG